MESKAFKPLTFMSGSEMSNRFALAPMTNTQSMPDGTLGQDEIDWLLARATGGFGMVMTAAAHVDPRGQGFPGQLGVCSDEHDKELTRLASELRALGALPSLQLHHGGGRSPAALIGMEPVGPSDGEGIKGLTDSEVEQLIEAFVSAAVRAQHAGFDGVELHGGHGYIITQFLSSETNQRSDKWGGSYDNRTRLLRRIIEGVRVACGSAFTLGVRLSPERYGIDTEEALRLARELMQRGDVDFVDMSLWDYSKSPEDERYNDRPLIDWFAEIERGSSRLGVAGKITSSADVSRCMAAGADFLLIGRAAILHAHFPKLVEADSDFQQISLPATEEYLKSQAVGQAFVNYLRFFPGFVA